MACAGSANAAKPWPSTHGGTVVIYLIASGGSHYHFVRRIYVMYDKFDERLLASIKQADEKGLEHATEIMLKLWKQCTLQHQMHCQSNEDENGIFFLGGLFEEQIERARMARVYEGLCLLVAEYRRRNLNIPTETNKKLRRNVTIQEEDLLKQLRWLQ